MRPSRRLHLPVQATLLAICFIVCPRAVLAQNSAQLPPQWNDAVSQLADKIAANVSPLHPLSLEAKNMSSLSPTEASQIRGALESKLKNRSFHFVLADPAAATAQRAAKVQFAISEGAQGYVLVAEIQNSSEPDSEPQIAIVSAPKSPLRVDEPAMDSLSLDKRLIYRQAEKFLDFALLSPEAPANPSLLVILEPERLAYYRQQDASWRFSQAVPIVRWRVRDLRGRIDNDGTHVYLGDVTCTGKLAQPETLKCIQTGSGFSSGPVFVAGDTADIGSPCKTRAGYLESGPGDWTQTDSIQGYESNDSQFNASGAPIETPGPIMSFGPGFATSTARAVVYNLKTKNYEAYIVTATCSH